MLASISRAAVRTVITAAAALAVLGATARHAHAQADGLKVQRPQRAQLGAPDQAVPMTLTADSIEGLGALEVEASGNAELRQGDMTLTADRIRYAQEFDEAEATGSVRLRLAGDEVSGPRLRLRLRDTTGIFEQPSYRIAPRARPLRGGTIALSDQPMQVMVEGRGDAQAFRFDGENHYRVSEGTFTTCKPGQDDWFFEARELDLDMEREVGTARNARLTFLGVSTPRLPWFDFTLNNDRKSGFLLPTLGLQNGAGFQVALPFYVNLAPNYDWTVTPRYMQERGTQILNEVRFLQPWFVGNARYDVLPEDQTTGEQRYGTLFRTDWNLQNGWTGLINYQYVSDDNYFRDLSAQLPVATQTYLPQEATVNYGAPAGWWGVGARVQRFQTLQDPQNPVAEPYFREPQLTLNVLKQGMLGLDLGLQGEMVEFASNTLVPTGRRVIAYPNVALPLLATYGFFTPKVGVHATTYNLRSQGTFQDSSLSRTLPIASVDTGLVFERDSQWGDSAFVQTVEPRLYYLYVPFREQSTLPVFDTSTADFNMAQLFQENIFVGGDRIANANQLSLALTSRMVRTQDGQEILRATIGQRRYFDEQKVFVPGQPVRSESVSPTILGLAGRITPEWTTELGVQYHTVSGGGIDKFNAGVRYSPAPAAVASVSYRYTAQALTAGTAPINGVDVAAQWPLIGGLYGLGRYSYDIEGNKAVEQLFGLEYNAGCWIVRAVAHQFQTATARQTTAIYLQLEFNGFARVGSNPFQVLRRNIPGYSLINQAAPALGTVDIGPLGGGTSSPSSAGAEPLPGASGEAYRTNQ